MVCLKVGDEKDRGHGPWKFAERVEDIPGLKRPTFPFMMASVNQIIETSKIVHRLKQPKSLAAHGDSGGFYGSRKDN